MQNETAETIARHLESIAQQLEELNATLADMKDMQYRRELANG